MKFFDSIPILKDIPMFIGCAPLFDSLNCMFCLCNKKKMVLLVINGDGAFDALCGLVVSGAFYLNVFFFV